MNFSPMSSNAPPRRTFPSTPAALLNFRVVGSSKTNQLFPRHLIKVPRPAPALLNFHILCGLHK